MKLKISFCFEFLWIPSNAGRQYQKGPFFLGFNLMNYKCEGLTVLLYKLYFEASKDYGDHILVHKYVNLIHILTHHLSPGEKVFSFSFLTLFLPAKGGISPYKSHVTKSGRNRVKV